jgi:hypothetical protein
MNKQETLEEASIRHGFEEHSFFTKDTQNQKRLSFYFGAKWNQERSYSEEEVIAIVEKSKATGLTAEYLLLTEQFKKK